MGLPEPAFRRLWIRDLVAVMMRTSKGHRLNADGHTGKTYRLGDKEVIDRRGDKLGERPPKWLREIQHRARNK